MPRENELKDDKNDADQLREEVAEATDTPKEYGGPKGKEPTRYGDWERKGRCIDF